MTRTVFPPTPPEPPIPESDENKKLRLMKERANKIKIHSKTPWVVFQVTSCPCKKHTPKSTEEKCIMDKWKYYDDRHNPSLDSFDSEAEAWIMWNKEKNWLL